MLLNALSNLVYAVMVGCIAARIMASFSQRLHSMFKNAYSNNATILQHFNFVEVFDILFLCILESLIVYHFASMERLC